MKSVRWGKAFVVAIATMMNMAIGKKAKVKFKPGILSFTTKKSLEDPKTSSIDIDRHVGKYILECIEDRVNKVENNMVKMEEKKQTVPSDDIQSLEIVKSIRDRWKVCLAKLPHN